LRFILLVGLSTSSLAQAFQSVLQLRPK